MPGLTQFISVLESQEQRDKADHFKTYECVNLLQDSMTDTPMSDG